MNMFVNGILLIYHHQLSANAPTIMEHVESFGRYSKFQVWEVNTEYGFPCGLKKLNFAVVVLHYSLFGYYPFSLREKFLQYIENCKQSTKVMFFQDEMRYCQQRFTLINRLGIDIIYSLLEVRHFEEVYYKNTTVKQVIPTLTGYVCDSLIEKTARFVIPFALREVDVGYRARQLPFFMGRGAQEKSDIAKGFVERCADLNLRFDIKTDENDRIYGDDWNRFVANCKFMLGVEGGTSIFDLNGTIQQSVKQYLLEHPKASFLEVEEAVLKPFEEKINYRQISPRIFECAASRTGMVLFKGNYQTILMPDRHYIALEKNFSNFDEVLAKMRDREFVQAITENAYNDLINSGRYHYSSFIKGFDQALNKFVCTGFEEEVNKENVNRIINKDVRLRNFITEFKQLRYTAFPGRDFIKQAAYKLGYNQNR